MLAALMLALCPAKVPGQEAGATFPGWLVPVVRVLGDGRVVPTTGVVLAADTVLVPSEFVADDESIVVLDGGPDLARDGRTATVLRRIPLAGLAILKAPGLRRPVPRLALAPLRDGQGVMLQALAPPDLMAQGQARIQRPARLRRTGQASGVGAVMLDDATPLPNVTGVLLDACGQWAGYSAARGTPTLSTSSATLYQWVPELNARLAEAGVDLDAAPCAVDEVVARQADTPAPESPPDLAERDRAAGEEPVAEPGNDSRSESSEPSGTLAEEAARDFPEIMVDPEPFAGPAAGEPGPTVPDGTLDEALGDERGVERRDERGAFARWLPWGLAALMFLLAVVLGLRPFRRSAPAAPTERAAYVLEGESGRLLVPARDRRVDCTLGRFDVDLVVDAGSVSRRHARLFGPVGQLQLLDLESTNGTFVNGQRCAPGVAVPVSDGDTLVFGDQAFTLQAAARVGA
jgi:hypothetical protein